MCKLSKAIVQKYRILSGQSPHFMIQCVWVALDVPTLKETLCGCREFGINEFSLG